MLPTAYCLFVGRQEKKCRTSSRFQRVVVECIHRRDRMLICRCLALCVASNHNCYQGCISSQPKKSIPTSLEKSSESRRILLFYFYFMFKCAAGVDLFTPFSFSPNLFLSFIRFDLLAGNYEAERVFETFPLARLPAEWRGHADLCVMIHTPEPSVVSFIPQSVGTQ